MEDESEIITAKIAECFTRYLIGDADCALRELEELKGQFKSPPWLAASVSEYNPFFIHTRERFKTVLRAASA